VTVKNGTSSTISTWKTVVDLRQSTTTSIWSATVTQSGSQITATPVGWNASLAPGGQTVWGFCANKTGTSWQPAVVSAN
jgi:cellulase/cellobiase CelA1